MGAVIPQQESSHRRVIAFALVGALMWWGGRGLAERNQRAASPRHRATEWFLLSAFKR
jgi:hypothetical protein